MMSLFDWVDQMPDHIDAILFDMGGTLRRATNREFSEKVVICKKILELTGFESDPEDFARILDTRANAYRKWSKQELAELNEIGFWTQWMLPELAVEKVSALAVDLNQIWRNADRIYHVLPDAKETILGLFRASYRLGLVSNTTSSVEAPNLLDDLGVAGCFEAVVLSCQVGIRKPRPEILLEATRRMGIPPERCAYIGNLPDRDVAAARKAGFTRTVILRDPKSPADLPQDAALIPDQTIDNLKELLVLFPARSKGRGKPPGTDSLLYDASLSSMWASQNFPELGDFFLAAGRLGFSGIELNHQIDSGMLSRVDLGKYEIIAIHEPCPADISVETLKKRDWLISSPDEDCRQQGLRAVRRSIELAGKLSVRTVVVHAGQVSAELVLENELRRLFQASLTETAEYQETKRLMLERRLKLAGPCMEAASRSLKELLEFASRFGIRLGLENRYHYFDIPTQDEMSALLELAEPDRLGFIYDVGHATAMDRLGFFPNELWLKRFGGRIFGSHLHDVIRISDHHAPGLGDVDFHMLAGYLPKDSFRTIEVTSSNTPEQIRTGLIKLVDTGCVNLISRVLHKDVNQN
jgi:FMN phosphatase YigB (HAD superfamily)/sugar phosphate isomerase/epimerase